MFGLQWQTSPLSIWGYSVSFSIFVTLILSLLLGALADERGIRRLFLGLFTAIGCISTFLLGVFEDWATLLVCFVFSSIGFAGSNVFYNSLLPVVADEQSYDSVSLKAFAWGYISGGLMLAINLLMILKSDWFFWETKAGGTRYSFILVSIWWAAFTIPALIKIKETKLALSKEEHSDFLKRLKGLWHTLRDAFAIKALLIFIIAFAFYRDGIETVISMATPYGREVLGLTTETLIGVILLIQILGWPMTLLMTKVSKRFGPKPTLTASLCLWLVIVTYAFFMQEAFEFWILGGLVAVVQGVSQALTRSIYVRLIPAGRQAEFFSLFALSGKFASIFGPLMFAMINDLTGSSRFAILSLSLFFVIGIILLQFVSIDRKQPA